MAIDVFVAAKTLGDACDWSVSNLKMQKILYLAHLGYMGKHKEHLIKTPFEAWDYGPVQPALYHKLKRFGARNVSDIFYNEKTLTEGKECDVLQDMSKLCSVTPGELVAITHREGGAWSKVYKPGALGMVIPDKLIFEEYDELFSENKKS